MTTLTPEQIEAIRKRAEAATPGPWEMILDDTGGPFTSWPSVEAPEDLDTAIVHRAGFKQEFWEAGSLRQCTRDADFIAHARQDIPALLSALEAAERRAGEAEQNANGVVLSRLAMTQLERDTLRARVERLERALKKTAIVEAHRMVDGGGTRRTGFRCEICGSDGERDGKTINSIPHANDCPLATLTKKEPTDDSA